MEILKMKKKLAEKCEKTPKQFFCKGKYEEQLLLKSLKFLTFRGFEEQLSPQHHHGNKLTESKVFNKIV